jgi:hypothetical protein
MCSFETDTDTSSDTVPQEKQAVLEQGVLFNIINAGGLEAELEADFDIIESNRWKIAQDKRQQAACLIRDANFENWLRSRSSGRMLLEWEHCSADGHGDMTVLTTFCSTFAIALQSTEALSAV